MISWKDDLKTSPTPAPAKPLLEQENLPSALRRSHEESRVVVSSALSRPMILPTQERPPAPVRSDPPAPESPAPPSPEVYREALAAVFAQAGLAMDSPTPEPVPEPEPEPEHPSLFAPPQSGYSPDQIVAFLSSLPGHLSRESRYARMAEELSQHQKNDPSELVGEAAMQLVSLRQELTKNSHQAEASLQHTRIRIEQLEAELAQLRYQVEMQEQNSAGYRQSLLMRIDEMTGVIVFFDGYQSYLLRRDEQDEEEAYVPPTFLDEETALRLLDQRS
ncbi:hypothetical protein [Armatimonas sp.]|uniref:hypothetical protein n=1 Tax=Armatimonas sp. TaxID=1872638 RepID=UPI00286BB1A1|nr:hypothetical protein [Armatimonas sp.]